MIIKVCGMRDAENIRAVSDLGIDMIGFIFYKESPRYVQMISARAGIIPDYSRERLDIARGKVTASENQFSASGKRPKRVGVFVDEMPQTIITRIYNYDLDYVQLHGNESSIMIDNLRSSVDPDIRPGVKIVKALSISGKADIERWHEYEGHADLLLFDTRCKSVGGSGEHFDWSIIEAYDGNIPFILSGGIGPEDAGRIRQLRHPMLAGIDLNSRFETEPGVKDVDKLRDFIEKVRR